MIDDDTIKRLQQLGDPEHSDLEVAREGLTEIIDLRLENDRLRAVVSALAFQANRNPFVSVGYWCEHGPCAAIIADVAHPNADHHGPDWTDRDSEYLK